MRSGLVLFLAAVFAPFLIATCEATKTRARRNFLFWRSSPPKPKAPAAHAQAKADPCKKASDVEKCHYEQAVALLENLQANPTTLAAAPTAVSSTPAPQTVTQSAAAVSNGGTQAAALKLALEALEGRGAPPPQLDSVTQQLEDALENVEPGALSSFRSTHLAAAFNAVGEPPTLAQKAAAAQQALGGVVFPADSGVPVALDALRSVAGPMATLQAHGASLFAQVDSAISTMRGSVSAGFSHLVSRI